MAETANQIQTLRNTKIALRWHSEVVEDTSMTDSLDRSTSETPCLSLGLGTSRRNLVLNCVSTSEYFLRLLLSGQTRIPLWSL